MIKSPTILLTGVLAGRLLEGDVRRATPRPDGVLMSNAAPKEVAGDEFSFRYRMYWWADEPFPTPLARCVATRLGNGGQAGTVRPQGWRKFMVEFKGKPLEQLPSGVIPEPVLTASRGEFHNIQTEAVPNDVPGHWRTQFDLATTGSEPVELRCYLRSGDSVLTESWLYQYHPMG